MRRNVSDIVLLFCQLLLGHVEPKLISITWPSLYLQNLLVPSVHCDINTPAKAIDVINAIEETKIKIILNFLFTNILHRFFIF